MIPKIIHHCGPSDRSKWDPIWHPCYNSWLEHFPEGEYKHIYWSNEETIDVVHTYYPEFKQTFDSFPMDVLRWDFSRYCIMHKYGGIYADLDIYCYKNFYEKVDGFDIILVESIDHSSNVENSLMASKPSMDFYYECLKTSERTYLNNKHLNPEEIKHLPEVYSMYVSNISGINMLSNVYQWFKNDQSISIGIFDFGLFLGNRLYYSDKIYTRHMCTDSWGGYGREQIDLSNFDFYTNYAGYE
jgi:hypothetical protein